jgi:hypothetical protein
LKALSAAVLGAVSTSVFAVDFEFGDGWSGSWENSLSLGTAWRADSADPKLYGPGDGALVGRPGGKAPNNTDEGNLNYRKGDRFTTMLKWITEAHIHKGDMGGFVRAKGWYDYTLNEESVRYGNQNNGYRSKPLSDRGFDDLNRFDGFALLDAYVYNTFDIAGKPLQVRAGNQVVNWGESLFIQGINQINPIDVPSFHKPGAQLKEVFLPVPIVHLNQSLGAAGSFEMFYQAKWKPTPIDMGCGNYWSIVGSNIGSSVGPCNNIISLAPNQPAGTASGAFVGVVDHEKPRNSGEFGAAYRFYSDSLDTEFGVYGMKYHSRTPIVSLVNVGGGSTVGLPVINGTWEYPEDIKAWGISASTNIHGWSLAGEFNQRRGMPVQIDGNDLLFAGLAAGGALGPSMPFGPYGATGMQVSRLNGGDGYLKGYTRANVSQIQVNAVKAGNDLLGGDQYIFVAEAAYQRNDLPEYKSDPNALRHGRGFIFGPGSSPLYGGNTCQLPSPLGGTLNTTAAGCANDGYVSKNAWGYRMKLDVTYNDVFYGVAVTPSVYWSHDVSGYSADGQFSEGRQALNVAVKFSYAKKYTFDIGATKFNQGAKYDPLRDRGFYYATANISF